MATYSAPGVYIEQTQERPAPRPRLSSVTGFAGLASRGPINSPQRLENWGHFTRVFGGIAADSDLGPSVHGFFANGGRVCYVVRVERPIGDLGRPAAAAFELRDAVQSILRFDAANEGGWGNDLDLRLSASRQRMEICRLTAAAGAGDTEVEVTASVDLSAGAALSLVHPTNGLVREHVTVGAVPSRSRVQLADPLGQALPAGSVVYGHGLDLEVRLDHPGEETTERFSSLSLDSDHPRFIESVVNGEPGESSYLEKLAQGRALLVRCSVVLGSSAVPARPIAGVDLRLDSSLGTGLPAGIDATSLGGRIGLDGSDLVLEGFLPQSERDRLLGLSSDPAWTAAVNDLFNRQPLSQTTLGNDGTVPMDVRLYTGYDDDEYFPSTNPGVDGYQGLATLETVEEISLVAIPDLRRALPSGGSVGEPFLIGHAHMLHHCEKMADRFAVLDAPPLAGETAAVVAALAPDYVEQVGLNSFALNGALYFPWLRTAAIDGQEVNRFLPPCGFVAGIYALTDSKEGVHRAPANEVLRDVTRLEHQIDDSTHGTLNESGINVLRALPGRGIRIWGARTLSSDPGWRYVPMRRTMLALKKELRFALGWAVFEPDSPDLQRRIAAGVLGYMDGLFTSGVLAGADQSEAYFVRADDTVNTTESMAEGQVLAEIGFAPLYPSEFIVAKITRSAEAIDVRFAV